MTFAIETHDLRKIYGDKVAVRGLTLQVKEGEAFGFLGPNGAGKTTSLKMLLGLAEPTSGHASLFGSTIGNSSLRANIGFLPEHFRFHEWLTGMEFLRIHGRLYGMQKQILSGRVEELLEMVGLTAFSHKQLRTYSKGMLQRIGLAQALLNRPRLVFLDEPTSGLDPGGRRLVRDIIQNLRQQGTTVFLNSHLLSEVEITCDRVAFIKNGEVLRVDDLKTFSTAETTVAIRATGFTASILLGLKQWSQEVTQVPDGVTLKITNESVLPSVVQYLVQNNVQIYSVQAEQVALEDIFLRVVGKDSSL
jgi:ABC-2 type transport system ATP-binding protein